MSKDSYSSWCYGQPLSSSRRWSSEEEFESRINIITPVNIWQIGGANGGDANGGDGGGAVGGAAAAAFAESEDEGDATASAAVAVDRDFDQCDPGTGLYRSAVSDQNSAANPTLRTVRSTTEKQAATEDQLAEADQALLDLAASLVLQGEGATAIGGDATGGNGGNGGTGGDGGTVTNTAVVTNVNVLVFSNDETVNTPGVTIGTGNGKLNISSDETGTFVNGQKMDETALNDGTKVFVFRDQVKK